MKYMVYYEGSEKTDFNPTLESVVFLLDSINQQRKDLYSLTESIMTLEQSKSKGFLMETAENEISTEVKDNTCEVIMNFIKKVGNFIWKLLKNAILYLKSSFLKDNAKLLRANEKKYDSIHTDILEDFTYSWREPTPLLLDYLTNNTTKSDDMNKLWDYGLQYTAIVVSLKNNPIGRSQLGDDSQTIFQKLSNDILNNSEPNTSIVYSMDTFKKIYPLKLLDYNQKQRGMEYSRKILIKESMVPNKVITRLESSLREQQKSIEKFLEKINDLKDLPSDTDSLYIINTCRNIVNVLNSMAVVIANNTIESINVYVSQCRNVFLKTIAYANLHEEI